MLINSFFNQAFGDVLVVIDDNNKCWFLGNQIADILGYKEPKYAIRDFIKSKYKQLYSYAEIRYLFENLRVGKSPTLKINKRGMYFIDEPAVYKLIFKSNMPKAEEFQDWVFENVLPSIREKGIFVDLAHPYIRAVNKRIRKSLTHNINLFVKYSKLYNCNYDENQLYASITNQINKWSDIENGTRDKADIDKLAICIVLENNISTIITHYIIENKHPEDILKILYHSIESCSTELKKELDNIKVKFKSNKVIVQTGILRIKVNIRPK